ncbi:coat protein [Salicibibacter halophilus]|uniref:Coat protein n=1 Tax=Salicibibacter halophilus TaxID=2502791 RepID=A0A514LEE2_9BACI|nr:major capsid protein [Salicibibacter halophilus]QDI90217.1 coat protein [Salicibibacter halophilus]
MPTRISDVIVPEVFNDYVIQETAQLSALSQSGIISNNPELDALATSGGRLINMPFWEDLDGDDEVLSDEDPLTPGKITSGRDAAGLLLRGKAWGVNDLAYVLSGDDPAGAIASLVGNYWARRRQKTLISLLKGVFNAESMQSNVLDSDNGFNAESFIDAVHTLGDAEQRLTAMAVHSNTYASMKKQDLIEFARDSQGNPTIPTYIGRRVIVDDGLPRETDRDEDTKYTTYIFGQGAIGLGNGRLNPEYATEVDRDSLQGEDYLINRQSFILHPRGVRFTASEVDGEAPTNSELEDPENWRRVYEPKNVRIVAFKHTLEV